MCKACGNPLCKRDEVPSEILEMILGGVLPFMSGMAEFTMPKSQAELMRMFIPILVQLDSILNNEVTLTDLGKPSILAMISLDNKSSTFAMEMVAHHLAQMGTIGATATIISTTKLLFPGGDKSIPGLSPGLVERKWYNDW